jgi:hypothetical protein
MSSDPPHHRRPPERPVHVHPDVLVARAPHTTRWALSRPGNGPAPPSGRAVRRAGEVRRPIQRMPAPTDASWRHLAASSWGGGCGRRSPACIAGRRIAIRCAAIWMPSSRRVQPARQSFSSMSVSDSGLCIQRPSARRQDAHIGLSAQSPCKQGVRTTTMRNNRCNPAPESASIRMKDTAERLRI